MEKTELFVCRCHDVSHQLVLETLKTEEDEEHVVYGCFHLVHLEFWDKLKSATKYLFGRKRKDGDFDALLLRPEDADRLAWFANYLDGGISAIDKAVAPFGFTFCSKENVYEVALEAYQYTLNDGSVQTEYEMSVCVSIKPGNIFYRLYRTAKYLSGYCSCYGDFDSLSLCRLICEASSYGERIESMLRWQKSNPCFNAIKEYSCLSNYYPIK